jgi:hypothetical protein
MRSPALPDKSISRRVPAKSTIVPLVRFVSGARPPRATNPRWPLLMATYGIRDQGRIRKTGPAAARRV